MLWPPLIKGKRFIIAALFGKFYKRQAVVILQAYKHLVFEKPNLVFEKQTNSSMELS